MAAIEITTKFGIGDTCYMMENNEIVTRTVTKVETETNLVEGSPVTIVMNTVTDGGDPENFAKVTDDKSATSAAGMAAILTAPFE